VKKENKMRIEVPETSDKYLQILVDAGIYRDMEIALERILRVGSLKAVIDCRRGWSLDEHPWDLSESRTPHEVAVSTNQRIMLDELSETCDLPLSEAAVVALLQGLREEEYCPIIEVADELLSTCEGYVPRDSTRRNSREFHFFPCLCDGDTRCAEILIEGFDNLGIHGLCQTYVENGGICSDHSDVATEKECRALSTIYYRLPKRIRDRRL
jgi:hypothetical protein